MSAASRLYQEVILDHNRKPRNYGKLEDANRQAEGLNPLCGDHIWVYLRTGGGMIEGIGFEGQSCAICKASASMMTAAVKGKSVHAAEVLAREFRDMTTGKIDPEAPGHQLGRLTVFAGVRDLPARVKCAVLPWHTLTSALHALGLASTEGDADPVPGSGLEQVKHA
jgi:nitrogen fixation NifU-like protein